MMNPIQKWLARGNLTSDGDAGQVANLVIENLALLDDLVEALQSQNEAVRGHAADALEKVARHYPEPVTQYLPTLLRSSEQDPVAMVRWHLAMVFGHISMNADKVEEIFTALLRMLKDSSVFVQSWAIVSLCLIARQYPDFSDQAATEISRLGNSPSKAIQAKVRYALPLLTSPGAPFPKGWIKSDHLQYLCQQGCSS